MHASIRSLTLSIFFACFCLGSTKARAELEFCNKTVDTVWVAVAHLKDGEWLAEGWWEMKAGKCFSPIGDFSNRYYYYYAFDTGPSAGAWEAEEDEEGAWFCFTKKEFTFTGNRCPRGWTKKKFAIIDVKGYDKFTQNLNDPARALPRIKTGVIQRKCLISWDDSHQVHSVETVIDWNFQRVRTKMKKLRHCVELKVIGPVDIGGVAKSYVDACIDRALNDNKTLYLLQAVVALVGDVVGGGGSLSAANAYAYLDNVKTEAISCLTTLSKIKAYLQDYLGKQFDATVREESHWEYWYL
ncbi:hypothetical protein CK215_04265 [Mesorhizobium sp. WSM3864]|uniref:DUF1036 domain-containing protein n=1 Tax=Mesorhizobium sp. WSM3864 TaxID=2029404 RepID=UPI000BB07824|nr:DUF1036 domain-containing protein [Mesorhizobium sp. WSM3864]PBB93197.1 hypothetical protein CK215_04265 [Mesorhizobium sp. WSM3864]